uniref:NADP-dependent oxidoreductase n=1 Tax=Janibacter limosus TaxID=53458 RepID=A0AC61U5U0_9MICO|nr:NADP-dependent oxidoreductase [Janibacter limosus]
MPDPAPGEFLVEMQQVSLDPAMRGWLNDVRSYLPPVKIGAVMRAFGAGTVIASQHDDFAVGDVVSGTFGVREYAISSGKGVERLDLDVAPMSTRLGAPGMPGMTAWFGLEDVGRAKAGDTVLVSAAAGAVGSTVAQLAKAKGCRVIGVAGGPDKVARLRELGLDEVIDRREGDLLRQVRKAAPDGVDVYFDNVGGELLDAAPGQPRPRRPGRRLRRHLDLQRRDARGGPASVHGPARLPRQHARLRRHGLRRPVPRGDRRYLRADRGTAASRPPRPSSRAASPPSPTPCSASSTGSTPASSSSSCDPHEGNHHARHPHLLPRRPRGGRGRRDRRPLRRPDGDDRRQGRRGRLPRAAADPGALPAEAGPPLRPGGRGRRCRLRRPRGQRSVRR